MEREGKTDFQRRKDKFQYYVRFISARGKKSTSDYWFLFSRALYVTALSGYVHQYRCVALDVASGELMHR